MGDKIDAMRAVEEITVYAAHYGRPNKDWYVGITDDVQRRFSEHRLPNKCLHHSICCEDHVEARAAEMELHREGFDGAGGGPGEPRWVYVYLKQPGVTTERE